MAYVNFQTFVSSSIFAGFKPFFKVKVKCDSCLLFLERIFRLVFIISFLLVCVGGGWPRMIGGRGSNFIVKSCFCGWRGKKLKDPILSLV